MVIVKGYIYRIYPNEKQEEQIQINAGHSRFVYNALLDVQEENYKRGGKFMNKTAMNNYVNNVLKPEHEWLRDADKFALTNAAYALEKAYRSFFEKRSSHPKHKSKRKAKRSYTTNFTNNNIEIRKDKIKLPKLGWVKAVTHRSMPNDGVIKGATVTDNKDGTHQVSVLIQYEIPDIESRSDEQLRVLGLDYKSDGLYVDQNGKICGMPHFMRESEARLVKAMRKLSHMIESHIVGYKIISGHRYPEYDKPLSECKNIEKQHKKVARIHAHIVNQRKDFLHKQSFEIANQYDVVATETLNLKAMANKGFGNGKATMDNGYGMFLNMLEYKLNERGGLLIKVDKWYPSSQLCDYCGHKHKKIKDLSIRKWECPVCGKVHDRDQNAAINIRNEGLRIFNARIA